MLFGTGLGANPFSSIAKGVRTVVSDQRVQNVANVAAQQYAPKQYAQAYQVASQVKRALRPPGRPQRMQQLQPMQMYEEPPVPTSPIKQSSILTIAAIGGALVVILLLARK